MGQTTSRFAVVLMLVIGIAQIPRVSATIVVSLDLTELVQAADSVAYGRVVDIHTVRVEGRYSETLVTLAPSAMLKGTMSGDIVFRVPGGDSGRYRTVVVGAPVLHVNDEIVVFLAGQAPRIPHVVGFSQGVLPVMRDDARRPIVLAPPVADRVGGQRVIRGGAPTRVMMLSAFADDVRAIAEGRARGERLPPAASTRPGAGGPGRQ